MTSTDLNNLDIDQLNELLGKAQTEMATREKQGRRGFARRGSNGRVAAEGYKMADNLPPSSGPALRAAPAANGPRSTATRRTPNRPWSGIGRAPKWVQAILDERGIDMAAFKSIPMYQIHASS